MVGFQFAKLKDMFQELCIVFIQSKIDPHPVPEHFQSLTSFRVEMKWKKKTTEEDERKRARNSQGAQHIIISIFWRAKYISNGIERHGTLARSTPIIRLVLLKNGSLSSYTKRRTHIYRWNQVFVFVARSFWWFFPLFFRWIFIFQFSASEIHTEENFHP